MGGNPPKLTSPLARQSKQSYPADMSAAQSETPRGLARIGQFGRAALGLVLEPRCRRCARPAASRSAARRAVRGVLVQGLLHRTALLRAPGNPVRLRSRSRHPVHGGDRRSARLWPRPCRRALRRRRPRPRARAQIWRPPRPRRHARRLDGAGRARTSRRSRSPGAGAAALAPAVRAALQPGRGARLGDLAGERGSGVLRRQAGAGDAPAGRPVARRAAANVQGAFRVPAATRRPCMEGGSCWSTTC